MRGEDAILTETVRDCSETKSFAVLQRTQIMLLLSAMNEVFRYNIQFTIIFS